MIPLISIVLIFILILFACIQDFKKREINHWTNILIFVTGLLGLITSFVKDGTSELIYSFLLLLVINFLVTQLFYRIGVMGGGDCDLLLSLTPLLATPSLIQSFTNLGLFIILVLLAGSLYGMIYITALYLKHFKSINNQLKKEITKKKRFFLGAMLFVFTFLSLLNPLFIGPSILIILFPSLYFISKILDTQFMTRKINGSELYEKDILTKNIYYHSKHFQRGKPLSKIDVELLSQKKFIEIKDGIPFAPSFLLAIICYILMSIGLLKLF